MSKPAMKTIGRLARHGLSILALLALLCAIAYWGWLASDRYISEARVVVDRTDYTATATVDFGGLLGGNARKSNDVLVLREHLKSVDMLQKLQQTIDLRAHYSNSTRDYLSRLKEPSATQEIFHKHYLARTSFDIDDQSDTLTIRAQAYDAVTAQRITKTLMHEGEKFLNGLAQQLARDQVLFLEQQVVQGSERATKTRLKLIQYQNSSGMISPQGQAESLGAIASRLEGQVSELKVRRAGMLGYLSPTAPDMVQLDFQIQALETQLRTEKRRLAAPTGNTLNRNIEEYQRLEAEAAFAQDIYKTALVALEKGRIEAIRMIKKLSVLQSATLPEYPVEPRRIYNLIAFAVSVLALLGIANLMISIIRDHQD